MYENIFLKVKTHKTGIIILYIAKINIYFLLTIAAVVVVAAVCLESLRFLFLLNDIYVCAMRDKLLKVCVHEIFPS
jgi:hypothetical protein